MPTYRAAPTMLCYAPAKSFPSALDACQYARAAADAYRVPTAPASTTRASSNPARAFNMALRYCLRSRYRSGSSASLIVTISFRNALASSSRRATRALMPCSWIVSPFQPGPGGSVAGRTAGKAGRQRGGS